MLPDIVFEISWEVGHKVGGIHTVISTKSPLLKKKFDDNYITIGPDLWREDGMNPEFIEDPGLFKGWKLAAEKEGIRVRSGRWNIPSQPIALIVDFTPLIPQKDVILSAAWETYKLDSISGQWDYVEAGLFGYASGMAIKSFAEYYRQNNVLAHFHEWMTGMGILFLNEHAPNVATLFTTHATTIGRSIAGNGLPLYDQLESYVGDEMANLLNVKAKHSIEKMAAYYANSFSTVSEITGEECRILLEKTPDFITPNGFDPDPKEVDKLKANKPNARSLLRKVAESVIGEDISEDHALICTSGRYEFANKGIDLFIDLLSQLNQSNEINRPILAFILVPANNYGPRNSVLQRLAGEQIEPHGSLHLSHNLHDAQDDPILRRLAGKGLTNQPGTKVKVIFVPCYLDGKDGVINLVYYQVLAALDLTVFPSFYEPWGYTPHESIAYGIPTITTDLAGFGLWSESHKVNHMVDGVGIVNRRNRTYEKILELLFQESINIINLSAEQWSEVSDKAGELATHATWKDFINHYFDAFELAMSKVIPDLFPSVEIAVNQDDSETIKQRKCNAPLWNTLLVDSAVPASFELLTEISQNLWWTWNPKVERLFSMLDPEGWEEVEHNPVKLLRQVSMDRLQELTENEDVRLLYEEVGKAYQQYMGQPANQRGIKIAYFSMEFGFHSSLKIYSGGLGILAGDYLKEASDQAVPMVGVGLLYKYGYFRQLLTLQGDQVAENVMEDFSSLAVNPVYDEAGNWINIEFPLPGRIVYARIWNVKIGRILLYLLDTDFEVNQPADRTITHNLYGGDEEQRLKQEIILGVGGIRLLNQIGIQPDVFHCNEGHAAFIGLERIRQLMGLRKFTFTESLEIVRASTLFTTHTPVPAGHDSFTEDLIRTYMGHYPEHLNISWEEFLDLGRIKSGNSDERFSMSWLASNLSQEINAVSNLHGEVTREMFKKMWDGFFSEELHIGYVTNGVHYPTWAAEVWQDLYLRTFGSEFLQNQSNTNFWQGIHNVADEEIWGIRQKLRATLIDYIKLRMERISIRKHEPPKLILEVKKKLNDQILTVGFARRFATYKRAHLLFKDLDRLNQIVNNTNRPVQFIFAGKAHPRDKAGQDLIKFIIEVSRRPEFRGRILFMENYDMTVAKKLVQGVDVWLNTPTRPLEASGTSGIKATMNGVMNFSVLDGWWCEGYRDGAGWALSQEKVYQDQSLQDELDAEMLYNIFEHQIIPLYYNRDEQGIPREWISHIKNTIAEIAPNFTTKRMMDDYYDRFYSFLSRRTSDIKANNYHLAREISRWKSKMARNWENIETVNIRFSDDLSKPLKMGSVYTAELTLNLPGFTPKEIGVELIVVTELPDGKKEFVFKQEFMQTTHHNGLIKYKLGTIPTQPGVYKYGIRVFPKNDLLPHRQDFSYLKWI